ncbi:conserved hypothetical protein [Candidatus Xenohaliotis californiensis]|uniref:Uncharacterized protein n=1 Tax=Candidatus Xenohaliotis californiensis TaxID=84677 RepID=A0ABM9N8Q8_9RICK|nr:conserved hypothetical protein [Candidatus Xenohaliotis californiensis]
MSKGKGTSKNNPNARKKNTQIKTYNGKEILPIMLLKIAGKRRVVAQYKNGSLVTDANGNTVNYKDISYE